MNYLRGLLTLAAVLAAVHPAAQSPTSTLRVESDSLKWVLLAGWRMPASGMQGVPAALSAALDSYRQRQASFRSRLTPPAAKGWVHEVSFEKRVRFERTIWSLFDVPDIARIAAAFAETSPLPYEWEGYPENPLAEAKGAETYLARDPGTPIAPYLHLFIAHRHLCAASLMNPSPERERAMETFRAEIKVAKQTEQPLIRFQAEDLAARPTCLDE